MPELTRPRRVSGVQVRDAAFRPETTIPQLAHLVLEQLLAGEGLTADDHQVSSCARRCERARPPFGSIVVLVAI